MKKNRIYDEPIARAKNVRIEDGVLKFNVVSLAKTKRDKKLLAAGIHFIQHPWCFMNALNN